LFIGSCFFLDVLTSYQESPTCIQRSDSTPVEACRPRTEKWNFWFYSEPFRFV